MRLFRVLLLAPLCVSAKVAVFFNTDNDFEVTWMRHLFTSACEDIEWTFCNNVAPCPVQKVDSTTTQVVVTRGLTSLLAATWPEKQSTVLFHLSDESPHNHQLLRREYLKWRHVYRHYWTNDTANVFEELSDAGRMTWLPLGYGHPFTDATSRCPRGEDTTAHFMSFFGNLGNNRLRGALAKEIEAVANVTLFSNVQQASFSSAIGAVCDYVRSLQQSAFCLNLPGTMSECFRFYESIESGCIPVVVNSFSAANYRQANLEQFAPLLRLSGGPNAPFVWVETPSDLVHLALLSQEAIAEKKLELRAWWLDVKKKIVRHMRKDLCPAVPRVATGEIL